MNPKDHSCSCPKLPFILEGVILIALLTGGPQTAKAVPIDYAVNGNFGGSTITGTLTTDGTIGHLVASNITDWNITLTIGLRSATFLGPTRAGTNSILDYNLITADGGLLATSTSLSYQFSSLTARFMIIGDGSTLSTNTLICMTSQRDCLGLDSNPRELLTQINLPGIGIATDFSHPSLFQHTQLADQIQGAPVPEPASFILLGSGFVGIFAIRKKIRKNV